MKKLLLVGILTGVLVAPALASGPSAGGMALPGGPQVAAAPAAPAGSMVLGTVRLGRRVLADGKPLAAGTYQLRLTAEEAKPPVAGQTESLERWVEFVQGGQVKGREVASIVPQSEIGQVADVAPPRAGASRVEMLKGNDYLRVWMNRGGNHYLIHLPPAA